MDIFASHGGGNRAATVCPRTRERDVLDAGESERPVQPHHFFVEGSVVQGCSLGHLEQIGADHLDMAQSLNLRRRHHRE